MKTLRILRGQILSYDELPSMSRVFYLIIQEEKQQKTSFRDKTEILDIPAFFAKKTNEKEEKGMYRRNMERSLILLNTVTTSNIMVTHGRNAII